MKTNVIFDTQKDTVSLTNVGKVRQENEDNLGYAETPNGDIFVVCDGMGGHIGGKIASSIAVDSIIDFFSSKQKANITDAIDEAIKFANSNIYNKTKEDPKLRGMGTTIVLLIIQEDKIYIGHVGDSRIYLMSDEHLYKLTSDHSYVQKLIEQGIINEEEAETHSRKNELLKALGIRETVEPEVANEPILLKNGDKILMCSDGLNGMVNDRTMQTVIKSEKSIKEKGQELIQLALNAGGKDNVTLHLIQISNSNYKETVFVDKSNTKLESTGDHTTNNIKLEETIDLTEVEDEEEKTPFIKKLLKPLNLVIIATAVLLSILAISFLGGTKYEIYAKKSSKDTKYEKIESFNDSLEAVNYVNKHSANNYEIFGVFGKDTIWRNKKNEQKVVETETNENFIIMVNEKNSNELKKEAEFTGFSDAINWFNLHKKDFKQIKIIRERGNQVVKNFKKGENKPSVKYIVFAKTTINTKIRKARSFNSYQDAEDYFEKEKKKYIEIIIVSNKTVLKSYKREVIKKPKPKIENQDTSTVADKIKPKTEEQPDSLINKENDDKNKQVDNENKSKPVSKPTGNYKKIKIPQGYTWYSLCEKYRICKEDIIKSNDENILSENGSLKADAIVKIPLHLSAKRKYNKANYKNYEDKWKKCWKKLKS